MVGYSYQSDPSWSCSTRSFGVTSNTITGRDRDGRVTAETVDRHEYRYDWHYCYQDPAGVNGAAPACTPGDAGPAGANANRTAAYHNGVKTAGYSYDLADRLTGVSVQVPYAGNTVSYDTRGNTTSLAGETLAYDAADRHLTTTKAANTVTYHRDVLDRIVARTGTDGTTRYTYGAGGDTTSAVLDTSNLLVHTTIPLPGGVLLSKAAGSQTWSHPNLHGSITALTDAAGVKQGGTFHYDPYGNPISGLPDNLAGDLDYGWLGQHQRPTEHPTGLRTQIDMGARGYDPQLARFLETDPIEGGVNNDYNHPTNPRNQCDLDGMRVCERTLWSQNLEGKAQISVCLAKRDRRDIGGIRTLQVELRPRGNWRIFRNDVWACGWDVGERNPAAFIKSAARGRCSHDHAPTIQPLQQKAHTTVRVRGRGDYWFYGRVTLFFFLWGVPITGNSIQAWVHIEPSDFRSSDFP